MVQKKKRSKEEFEKLKNIGGENSREQNKGKGGTQ